MSRKIFIAPKPSRAKKRVANRTFSDILTAEEGKPARLPAEFLRELGPTLQSEILDSMPNFSDEDLVELVNALYVAATAMADAELELKLVQKSPKMIREHRKAYSLARVHVSQSVMELRKARQALGDAGKSFKRGVLKFRPVEDGLKTLSRTLLELEVVCAVMVHPTKRTDLEKKLAARIPRPLAHTPLRATPGSASGEAGSE